MYDGRTAAHDLATRQTQGLRALTQELIDAMRREEVEGATVPDIGAGVGASTPPGSVRTRTQIAQAMIDDWTIVTRDPRFRPYGVNVLHA